MGVPWVETPDQPDEVDVVDAGDVVEGAREVTWRRVVECVGLGGGFW
jgi:hypothetical protein